MINKLRGTGRTTQQLKALPLNAIYISCNHSCIYYDTQLTRMLNRRDIQVVGPDWVTSMRWQGLTYSAIEVDHAYPDVSRRTALFYEYLQRARTRVRP